MKRAYLDYNASAPLRPEAKHAMVQAMDCVGNPSSVHSEGRASKAIVERAREQIAQALGAQGADIIFTSGATEAAGLALHGRALRCADVEHEAVRAWCETGLSVDKYGQILVPEPERSAVQLANSETGVLQSLPEGVAVCDMTQAFGKLPVAFNWTGAQMGLISAHKIGGPKGVGALVIKRGTELAAQIKGGGQEMGRRSGTENLVGIAGFGAAAEAAIRDVEQGLWDHVEKLRNILENSIEQISASTIFIGKSRPRLPNTSCIVTEGWKGETQVMQMDLAGLAVSAGSACSSGKVKESRVLQAMGFGASSTGSALRVSLGPDTRQKDIDWLVESWSKQYKKWADRAMVAKDEQETLNGNFG